MALAMWKSAMFALSGAGVLIETFTLRGDSVPEVDDGLIFSLLFEM